MTDDELITSYYSQHIPFDDALLEPLRRVLWSAARLHSTVRDTLGLDMGPGLSDEPFDRTLGQVIGELVSKAGAEGEPWRSEIRHWADGYGRPAQKERDRIIHAVPHAAPDGRQALSAPRRHGGPDRLMTEDLNHACGHLTLASVGLQEARSRCEEASA